METPNHRIKKFKVQSSRPKKSGGKSDYIIAPGPCAVLETDDQFEYVNIRLSSDQFQ